VACDQLLEVFDGGRAQLDAGHALELVQGDRLSPPPLVGAEPRALVGAGDRVE
jgi:hypothetical protein